MITSTKYYQSVSVIENIASGSSEEFVTVLVPSHNLIYMQYVVPLVLVNLQSWQEIATKLWYTGSSIIVVQL